MLTTIKKKIKATDSLRNNLLNNSGILNKKPYENRPYNEYINLNSLMNNQISLEYTLSTTERTKVFKEDNNISNDFVNDKNNSQLNILKKKPKRNNDYSFLTNLIFHDLDIKQIRYYIFHIQKKYNKKYGNYLKFIIKNKDFYNYRNSYFIKEINEIEKLIARYSIIIFFLIRYKEKSMAKNIFLLMMKENINYIDFFEKNIFKEYSNIHNNIKLINSGCPKSLMTLTKIYSIILKYSLIFNITKNRNIFLSRYLSLQKLNYNLFFLKSEIRGGFIVTDIAAKYLYASCLFNACYYSIKFYSSMIIPIKFSELIFKLYVGINELIFDKKEKSLLLKTLFNYALFIYINGNNELALGQLELIKEKLIEFYEYNDNDEEEEKEEEDIGSNNDKYNPIDYLKKKKEIKKKLSLNFEEKIQIKRQETMKRLERRRGLSTTQKTLDIIKEILFNKRIDTPFNYNSRINIFDPLQQAQKVKQITSKIRRKPVKIDDIKKFIISDVKTVLNQRNRKCSITERDLKHKQKIQSNFGVLNKSRRHNSVEIISDLRASHINFKSLLNINKINLPKYITNSILLETELLMCEIQIDSKNFNEAYDHFKNSVLVLFISKQNDAENDVKRNVDFRKKLRIISVYLKEINKFIDENDEKEIFQIIKNPIVRKTTFNTSSKDNVFKEKGKEINFKKASLHLGKNYLFNFSFKMKKKDSFHIKEEEYYNQLLKKKTAKEIEKFFIFICSLSIYQIKLLNDTQPKRKLRNYLPILFNGAFTDSLTSGQRNSLRYLNTMSITRSMILEEPDKLILPTNIKLSALNYSKTAMKKEDNNNYNFNDNKNKKKSRKSLENDKVYEKAISLPNYIENEYFKKVISSNKLNKILQQFLLDNYSLVIKILRELNKKEIEDVMKNPDILVFPINYYKKTKSKINNNNSNMINNNFLFKINGLEDLKKNFVKISKFKNEKINKSEEEKHNNIIKDYSDSENNNSINISINNDSFYNNE